MLKNSWRDNLCGCDYWNINIVNMTEAKLYYTAPSDRCFEEMKRVCIEVWGQYDNEFGYVDEKVGRIKEIGNVGDNFMFMLAMFDQFNQRKVVDKLSEETKKEVRDRMVDGGNEEEEIMLVGL